MRDRAADERWSEFGCFGNVPTYATRKDAHIEDRPHYADQRFDMPRTVYLALGRRLTKGTFGTEVVKGAHYNYDDRLWQADYDKSRKAWEEAEKSGLKLHTPAIHEAYLAAYFGKPVELLHIVAGVNRGNGYPYLVYGYRHPPEGGE